jgi:EAL domain-containing protein (putative c-di-GMP-specific phosphodiesterase class I)
VLCRWISHGKFISPDRFIAAAEETNQILPLGEWLMDESCRQLRQWLNDGILPSTFEKLAINISAIQFMDIGFEAMVLEALARHHLRPDQIELELTESVFVGNPSLVKNKMTRLSEHGFHFALDDFGTGYSSLSYLQHLPLGKLKIDRSFVMDIDNNDSPARIVDSIIQLGRNLHIDVIAEGVETRAQRDYLASRDCLQYQGYFFSRPLDKQGFVSFTQSLPRQFA